MPTMTHPLCLLHKKPTQPLHFCQRFCHRAPLLATILSTCDTPLNTTTLAFIFMPISRITANLKSQKHLHVILSKLAYQNNTPQTMWYQRTRCASLESRPEKSQRRKLFWLWNLSHHHHQKMCTYSCSALAWDLWAWNQTPRQDKLLTWASWQLSKQPHPVQNHSLTFENAGSHALTLRATWTQPPAACWVAQFVKSRKRHLMTLRHQSKTLLVMSAICYLPETLLASREAHLTPGTTTKQCEALWRLNGLKVRQAK